MQVNRLFLGLQSSTKLFRVGRHLPGEALSQRMATLSDISLTSIPDGVIPHKILTEVRVVGGGIHVPPNILEDGLEGLTLGSTVYGDHLDGDFFPIKNGIPFLNTVMRDCLNAKEKNPGDRLFHRRGVFAGLCTFESGGKLGLQFTCNEFKNGDLNNFTVMVVDLKLRVMDRREE